MMQAADREFRREVVVRVQHDPRQEFSGHGCEKRGELRAAPRRFSQMVIGQARGEEVRENGELARIGGFGGDDDEFHVG